MAQFLPPFVQPIRNFTDSGQTGADFADFVVAGYGAVVYEQIAALPKETILAGFSMTQGLADLPQTIPAKINAFLDEFRAPDSVPPDEDERETEPAAV